MIGCHLRSKCKQDADRAYIASLFDGEWEVFVIRRDESTGEMRGMTVCCEAALPPPAVQYA